MDFFRHLSNDSQGIWRPQNSNSSDIVSYPDFGHEYLFKIEDESFWFQHRNEVIREIINRFDPLKKEWFLDIGGGNGVVASALQKDGRPVVMLEAGKEGVANAKARAVSAIVHSTLADAKIPNASVFSAGIFDVLEHQAKPIQFLNDINRILKPDGLLYVTVPAHQLLWSEDDRAAGHFKRYSVMMLKDEFRTAGLEMVYSTYFFRPLILPIFLFRTLPSLIMPKRTIKEKIGNDHKVEGGLATKLMRGLLRKEFGAIQSGKRFQCGSSIIAVARKI